jgi:hypothetical protein
MYGLHGEAAAAGETQETGEIILSASDTVYIPDPCGRPGEEAWIRCPDLFCPACGIKGRCFMEGGLGDIQWGESYVCIACENVFFMPIAPASKSYLKRIESLRLKEMADAGTV